MSDFKDRKKAGSSLSHALPDDCADAESLIRKSFDYLLNGIQSNLHACVTDLNGFDRMIEFLRSGELCVLQGVSGCGKTRFIENLVLNASIQKHNPVLYITTEFDPEVTALRLIAMESRVGYQKMIARDISDSNWGKIAQAAGLISTSHLSVCCPITKKGQLFSETILMRIKEFSSACNAMVEKFPTPLIIIDSLNPIVTLSGKGGEAEEQNLFLSELKRCAVELSTGIVIAQGILSDQRTNPASDQHADIVVNMWTCLESSDDPCKMHKEGHDLIGMVTNKNRRSDNKEQYFHMHRQNGRCEEAQ